MRNILNTNVSDEILQPAFAQALATSLKNHPTSDPFSHISEIQGELKRQFGESLRFNPGIVMGIKSLMVSRQHLDPKVPDDAAFQTAEFARLVLGKPPFVQKAMAALTQMKVFSENGVAAIKGWLGTNKKDQVAIERADATIGLIENRKTAELTENDVDSLINLYETVPARQTDILSILRANRDHERKGKAILSFLNKEDPKFKETTEHAIEHADGEKLVRLVEVVQAKEWVDLYPKIVAKIVGFLVLANNQGSYHLNRFVSEQLPLDREMFREFNRQMVARADSLKLQHLLPLNRETFKEIWAKAPEILARTRTAKDIHAVFAYGSDELKNEEIAILAQRTLNHLKRIEKLPVHKLDKLFNAGKLTAFDAAQRLMVSYRAGLKDGQLYRLIEEMADKLEGKVPHPYRLMNHRDFLKGQNLPTEQDSAAMLRDFALYTRTPEVARRAIQLLASSNAGPAKPYLKMIETKAHLEESRTLAKAERVNFSPDRQILRSMTDDLSLKKEGQDFSVISKKGKSWPVRFGKAYAKALWEQDPASLQTQDVTSVLTHLSDLGAFVRLQENQQGLSDEIPKTNVLSTFGVDNISNHLVIDLNSGTKVTDADLEGLQRSFAHRRSWAAEDRTKILDLLLQTELTKDQHDKIRQLIRQLPSKENRGLNIYTLIPKRGENRPASSIDFIWEVLSEEKTVSEKVIAAMGAHPLGEKDLSHFDEKMQAEESERKVPLLLALLPHLKFESPQIYLSWQKALTSRLEHPAFKDKSPYDANGITEFELARLKRQLVATEKRIVGEAKIPSACRTLLKRLARLVKNIHPKTK